MWVRRRMGLEDPRPLGQAAVHHRRCFIDAASRAADDALNGVDQVLLVREGDRRPFELAVALQVSTASARKLAISAGLPAIGAYDMRGFDPAAAADFLEEAVRRREAEPLAPIILRALLAGDLKVSCAAVKAGKGPTLTELAGRLVALQREPAPTRAGFVAWTHVGTRPETEAWL